MSEKNEIVKQNAKSNSSGNTTQVGRDLTVYNGLNYSEVKDVAKSTAMEVFRDNFYNLEKEMADIVQQRAEMVFERYYEKLEKKIEALNIPMENVLLKTNNIDFRLALYEVQKINVRYNRAEIMDYLTELLVEKSIVENEQLEYDFSYIVLNSAIEIIPKLTMKQLDFLGFFVFINEITPVICITPQENSRDLYIQSFKDYIVMMDQLFNEGEVINSRLSFEHMKGFAVITLDGSRWKDFSVMVKNKFNNLFEDLELDREYFKQDKNSEVMIKFIRDNNLLTESEISKFILYQRAWDNTEVKNIRLTTIGTLIGYLVLNHKFGMGLNLSMNFA